MPPQGYQRPTRSAQGSPPASTGMRAAPPADAVPPAASPGASAGASVEQLLLAAQRQVAEYVETVTKEAAQIKAAAESYAAGLRSAAEFETSSARADAEREAARVKAAAEREKSEIVTAARREADEIRRREQFLLEQSEALRSQAEADLEVEIAARREKLERQEVERLADAHEATRKLVQEAERRAADAEQRAADAIKQAEQVRREAEADGKKEIAEAHRKAELIIAQAKDERRQLLADIDAEGDKRKEAVQREVDELMKQKGEVEEHIAKMRQVFSAGALSALGDIAAS